MIRTLNRKLIDQRQKFPDKSNQTSKNDLEKMMAFVYIVKSLLISTGATQNKETNKQKQTNLDGVPG